MLGSFWNFIKRHRRKFIVTGAIVGGAVLLGKYAQKKLIEIQEKEAAECLAHARRQHHFDSNQRTCNTTVLSMLPSLREALLQALDTDTLTTLLKDRPSNKLEIWEDLKILSFTRTIVSVYCSCMLVVMLRVQLNIIGGYMYLDSISSKSHMSQDDAVATPAVQKEYLSMVQYLLGQGLADLIIAVQLAVKTVLDSISLKHQMGLIEIQEIIDKVREQVEVSADRQNSATCSLCPFMLPESSGPEQASKLTPQDVTMHRLMRETRDMMESPDFQTVLKTCLDVGFTRLLDRLSEYFKPVSSSEAGESEASFSPHGVCMPLAKIIPVMNGMVHSICSDSPNQFMQELLLKEQVRDFAANVYEAFSQPVSPPLHP